MSDVDYDSQADKWSEDKPIHLSGIIARQIIYDWIKECGAGKTVLDAGCGEGYPARVIAQYVSKVIAFDNSKGMLEKARAKEREKSLGIDYLYGDLHDMSFIPDESIDIFVANFSPHYLSPDELPKLYSDISRVLVSDGEFMVSIPHPCFILSERLDKTHRFDLKNFHYQKSRGTRYKGKLKTTVGTTLEVGGCHSKLEDHFRGIHQAGLAAILLKEPEVTSGVVKQYTMFKKLKNEVLFLIMRGIKIK
jgi:SAM-dependent methyltransferase